MQVNTLVLINIDK